MIIFLHKQLMAFFLVVAVFLAPLNSVAYDIKSGAAQESCVCQLLATDCHADDSGEQPGQCPGNNAGDYCDIEECCQEATEPPSACDARVNISAGQIHYSDSDTYIPTVYLAIFVPPQR